MPKSKKQKTAEQMLADLIFRASPRIDGREIARTLAERHGSLAPALEAHKVDLMRDGLSERAAELLALMPQLARYVSTESARGEKLDVLSGCSRYFAARCVGLHHERLFMLCLGPKGELRNADDCEVIDGTLDETPFYLRGLVERALRLEARYIVLCHNHPSGAAYASISDVRATRSMLGVCKSVGMVLLDHLIVADGTVTSMRQDSIGDAEFIEQLPGDKLLIRWPEV